MKVLEKKKILVVDDEPMLREILRDVLEYEGAVVQEAENGRVAFESYRKEGYHAIISDIRMPGGDGLELLESLRRLDCVTPVVMLITGFSDLSHDAAYNLGADAVLSKPFDVYDLLSRLSFLLTDVDSRWGARPEGAGNPAQRVIGSCVQSVGRGGMFVPGFISATTGEGVEFSVDCPKLGGVLEGTGVVRWVRRAASSKLQDGSGVEFRYLEPQSLERVLEWRRKFPTCAFIPDRNPE